MTQVLAIRLKLDGGYPAGVAQAEDWRGGWMPVGHLAPPEFFQGSLISLSSAQQVPHLISVGLGREGQKPHLATIPWGPALGAPGLFCGAQGAGWPRLQDLAGWGRRGQSRLWGPRGRFGVAQNSLTQGGALRGVGHLPQDLLSSYKQGNGVLGPGSYCGHRLAYTHTHTNPF